MVKHEVTRTLVKSQPEIWTQCSDPDALGRHLNFGEIRITRLEPERAVAWEGEEVSGTVRIESSAWGTRVTMTVQVEEEVPDVIAESPEPEEQEPVEDDEPVPRPLTVLGRLRRRFRAPAEEPEPESLAPPDPEPEQPEAEPAGAAVALTAALESLGQAHHRPFSRA